jgi:hypothetical protein
MKKKIDCNWHKCVDLGLPSGLLWNMCNIGAKEPWESGLYFSWGNVDGHKKYSGYDFSETEYATTPGRKLTTDIPVDAEYDAARANLGGSWRMPTTDEFQELYDHSTSMWTTQNGVYGRLFTSMINGNRVFLPAAGYCVESMLIGDGDRGTYWSSSVLSDTYYSFCLNFGCYHPCPQNYDNNFLGFPVRAVLDHSKGSILIKTIKR